jgi:hypothetical protein
MVPCQKSFDSQAAAPTRTLMVVVGPDEESVEVRKQLDNLGLKISATSSTPSASWRRVGE